MLIAETASAMDATHGAGNWLVMPTSELPPDFALDTYTIIEGNWTAVEKTSA